jgi:tRNA dimethylallyltransferase
MKKYLIVIGGPTASGKTAMAIRLAQYFSAEIISADSRQFYREMTIGTAKPTEGELKQTTHHFINSLSIHDAYSVGDFEKEALAVLNNIFKKNNIAIMVGGTGLYIKAVCEGLDEFPDTPLSIRTEFEDLFKNKGVEYLQKLLQNVDYEYFTKVDLNNPSRIIRALSVWKVSGKPYSSFTKGEKLARIFEPIYIYLDLPRAILYERINMRVDNMMQAGLFAEAEKLYPFRHLTALQTVGYSELFDYFDKKISLSEAIDKIKQHTRNYAKRQITWFRKDPHWQHFSPSDTEGVIKLINF